MTDQELQNWVERLSEQFFSRPFVHQAVFNHRLRSTGGRYFTSNHRIEISARQLETFGVEETEKIIKHELCHYHLHILKLGYKHKDADFKRLLSQVGGSRYCRSIPGAERREPYRYKLVCTDCHLEYLRKRKVDPAKYFCGQCRGRLRLCKLVSPS